MYFTFVSKKSISVDKYILLLITKLMQIYCFRFDNCYRCMAIHVKHPSVLQYKESKYSNNYFNYDIHNSLSYSAFCEPNPQEVCSAISGDALLHSMFRKYPEAKPIPCPFKSAPFTFSYNKGSGDCSSPVSKAESCTDDSRLVLKYQACPDVTATESYGKNSFLFLLL